MLLMAASETDSPRAGILISTFMVGLSLRMQCLGCFEIVFYAAHGSLPQGMRFVSLPIYWSPSFAPRSSLKWGWMHSQAPMLLMFFLYPEILLSAGVFFQEQLNLLLGEGIELLDPNDGDIGALFSSPFPRISS